MSFVVKYMLLGLTMVVTWQCARQVRYLSAGETKRLSVAAHLLQNPEVLILDGKTHLLILLNAVRFRDSSCQMK